MLITNFFTLNVFYLNSLPNDKISDKSKLEAIGDDKINVTEKLKFVLGRVENIVGMGVKAATTIFSFSYNVSKQFFCRVNETHDCAGNCLTNFCPFHQI